MYIVYYSVYCDYFGVLIGCGRVTCHTQCNVWPEIIYCCFTSTTLFTTMFIKIIVVCSLKSMCIPSLCE